MTDQRAIDDAVQLALDRTLEAQAEVEQGLTAREAPDEQAVETVVHLAEDLDVLVHEVRDARQGN